MLRRSPLVAAVANASLLLVPQRVVRSHVLLRLAQLPVFAHFRFRLARVGVLGRHARDEVSRLREVDFRVARIDATAVRATSTAGRALALGLVATREAKPLAVLRVGRAATGCE